LREPEPVTRQALLASLPPIWPGPTLREQIAAGLAATHACVVTLDDDPTGTQTAHDCWVVTRWEVDDLRAALAAGEPVMYVLTNSRALPLTEAQAVNRAVARNLAVAARDTGRPLHVVSRSDSTLRGHFPGEVDALAAALEEAGADPFDGVCLIPYFGEAGRLTVGDVQWVDLGGQMLPAARTPFARDPVFGYRASRLPEWIEEKTSGRVRAADVTSIAIETLRKQGPEGAAEALRRARGHTVVVNAAHDRDLEVFVCGLRQVEAEGMRFLFRSAAPFVKVAAGLPDRDLMPPRTLTQGRPSHAGLIVCGSYVPQSTVQVKALLRVDGVEGIELAVADVLNDPSRESTVKRAAHRADEALGAGRHALVYTSREVARGRSPAESLSITQRVAGALVDCVRQIRHEPCFVLAKGGITSSELATRALGVRAARVLGQVQPGVPVWRLGPGSRWQDTPFIVYPGNVGEEQSLADLVRGL
jgi:uncharacterized protein YgbK (DUF1537 family)